MSLAFYFSLLVVLFIRGGGEYLRTEYYHSNLISSEARAGFVIHASGLRRPECYLYFLGRSPLFLVDYHPFSAILCSKERPTRSLSISAHSYALATVGQHAPNVRALHCKRASHVNPCAIDVDQRRNIPCLTIAPWMSINS